MKKKLKHKNSFVMVMVKYMKKVLKDQKLFHRFNVLPNAVKEAFSFTTSADYDHDKLKIQYEDEGDKGYDNFYVLFCSTCSKDKYPEDIQAQWDELITVDSIVAQDHDFCGCIIPNDPSIIASPNNRRFILCPVEHTDKYHKLKETELSPERPAPTENQNPPPADIVVKKKCTLVGKGGQLATYENCGKL